MAACIAWMLPKCVNCQVWSSKISPLMLRSFTGCSDFRDTFVFSGRSWLLRPGSWRESCTACPATTRWESPSVEPAAGPLRAEWSMPWESNGMLRWGLPSSETSFRSCSGRQKTNCLCFRLTSFCVSGWVLQVCQDCTAKVLVECSSHDGVYLLTNWNNCLPG